MRDFVADNSTHLSRNLTTSHKIYACDSYELPQRKAID